MKGFVGIHLKRNVNNANPIIQFHYRIIQYQNGLRICIHVLNQCSFHNERGITMFIKPNEDFYCYAFGKLNKNRIYKAELATNQPDYIELGKVFVHGILLDHYDYVIYPKLNCEILEEKLPHGSGIDFKWEIEDKGEYFNCKNAFHCINDGGYYYGIAEFTVIIPKGKDFKYNFRIHFNGKRSYYFAEKHMLREYFNDLFYWQLSEIENELTKFE